VAAAAIFILENCYGTFSGDDGLKGE